MSIGAEAWRRHDAADQNNEPTYIDPETGHLVFTAAGLLARGRCCGCSCRHCPYAHQQVDVADRPDTASQPSWLTELNAGDKPADVLFWSGGKDSFLAYLALKQAAERPIALLTTFDALTRQVAHQGISIHTVVEQAKALDTPLLGVPLHREKDYLGQVMTALALVPQAHRLAFGDLHLEHIRQWREDAFTEATLAFPIWQIPYDSLIATLLNSGATCRVSATNHEALEHIEIGTRFDQQFVDNLPEGIDRMGENGEFHTVVTI